MSTVGYSHVEITGEGVPIVVGTKTKVIEIALDRLAYHWDSDEIKRQHPHLSLGQIHSALAYYYDHQDEMDAQIQSQLDDVSRIKLAVGESPVRRKLNSSVLLIQRRMKIRPVEHRDAEGITTLINSVYHEYGDRVHLEGAEADLADVVGHYSADGCAFVVLEDDGEVVGTHAVVPLERQTGLCTFRRLYLRPDLRGTGWGEKLMRWAIDAAEQMGFRRVEFWSDVRFTRAHRFFKRLGFQHDGRVRDMNDGWEPYREYFFSMDLS